MLKYEVIVLPLAKEDIRRNTDYIYFDKQAPETASNLFIGFERKLASLKFMPERYEIAESNVLAGYQIRRCCFKNYKIYFVINEKQSKVYVLRILHKLVDVNALLLLK